MKNAGIIVVLVVGFAFGLSPALGLIAAGLAILHMTYEAVQSLRHGPGWAGLRGEKGGGDA